MMMASVAKGAGTSLQMIPASACSRSCGSAVVVKVAATSWGSGSGRSNPQRTTSRRRLFPTALCSGGEVGRYFLPKNPAQAGTPVDACSPESFTKEAL